MENRSASDSRQNPTIVYAHNTFQIIGFILCGIVLITALISKHVKRSATWYLFMAVWMFWCVVYFLLVGQQLGKQPSPTVCALQAVMINTVSAATCWAILSISLEVFLLLYSAYKQRYRYQSWSKILTLCLPILVLLFAFIEQLVIATAKPDSIRRQSTGAFCVLKQPEALKITFALIVIGLGAVLLLKLATLYLLYKTWSSLRGSGLTPVSVGLVIRVLIFAALPVLLIIVLIVQMEGQSEPEITIVLTDCLPIAAALILGSQGDLMRVWFTPCGCWPRDRQERPSDVDIRGPLQPLTLA